MLRLPRSSRTQASRGSDLAAVRLLGNGALRTCSRVNACCARAGCGARSTAGTAHHSNTARPRSWFFMALLVLLIARLLRRGLLQGNLGSGQRPGNLQEPDRRLGARVAAHEVALRGQFGVLRKTHAALQKELLVGRRQPQGVQLEPVVADMKGPEPGGPTRDPGPPFSDRHGP